jgi:hypothetical protein
MGPDDDDIQFDFFEDEPATTEIQQATRSRLPRRGGSGPRRPSIPHRSLTPVLRLGALVVGLIVLLVVFGLVLQSCASTSKHDTYAHYMDKVSVIAKSSADNGAAVTNALVTPGIKASELSQKLSGIAEQERQNVAAAEKVDAPGPLRDENGHMIESLQLRVSGTQGLANAFAKVDAQTKASTEAAVLNQQANRLLASDVVWEDLFRVPSIAELQHQGVVGVQVPQSKFVTDPDLLGTSSMAALLNRITSSGTGSTPSGLHGTNIVQTKALPSGLVLSENQQNTINGVSTNLAFAVTIKDSGNFQEAGIKVTLTIQQKNPIVKTQTIDLINPGQETTVTFSNLGEPTFAEPAHVNVDVKPVPGEVNVSNNRASYPVIFSLGG